MKIKKTYKNQLPNNMEVKSTNVRIEGREIFIDIELEEKYIPKFGDIVKVISSWGSVRNYMICIMPDKDIPKKDTPTFYNIYNIDRGYCLTNCCGYITDQETVSASESEKQELFNELAKIGKKWNPITKQIEDIRWRAKSGNYYYAINMYGNIIKALDFEKQDNL